MGAHTITCGVPPIGKWGTCCNGSFTLDSIGWSDNCIENYLDDYWTDLDSDGDERPAGLPVGSRQLHRCREPLNPRG